MVDTVKNVAIVTSKGTVAKLEALMRNLDFAKIGRGADTLNTAIAITQTWQSVVTALKETGDDAVRIVVAPEIRANLLTLVGSAESARFANLSLIALSRDVDAVASALEAAQETDEALPTAAPTSVAALASAPDVEESKSLTGIVVDGEGKPVVA